MFVERLRALRRNNWALVSFRCLGKRARLPSSRRRPTARGKEEGTNRRVAARKEEERAMLPGIGDPMVKRKTQSKIYGLRTFLDPGYPTAFYGAFRDNVRQFLQECADIEERTTAGMPTWCTLLVDERSGAAVPLYTVEECVRRSPTPFCDYCRCSGVPPLSVCVGSRCGVLQGFFVFLLWLPHSRLICHGILQIGVCVPFKTTFFFPFAI